jgi:hypothetical protein
MMVDSFFRCARRSALLLLAAWLTFGVAPATAGESLAVVRADGSRLEISAEKLASLPHESFDAQQHDKLFHYSGIDIRAVLREAGIEPLENLRGRSLRRVLLVEAADNYAVVFAFAELDPSIGNKRVYLVDRQNDTALAPNEGPWRLVVSSESRPTRWVRQVVRVSVVDLK